MQTIQNTVIAGLELVKDKLEQVDETVVQREKVFATEDAPEVAQLEAREENGVQIADADSGKFKKVSYELLDIGLHYGNKGLEKVKSIPLYQKIDQQVHFADKFELI
jgi:hypothetical protein